MSWPNVLFRLPKLSALTPLSKRSILVIGAGSIGERHVRNLRTLGVGQITVLRSRRLPLRTLAEEQLTVVTSFDEAMQYQPEAAVICTPTSMHLEQTIECLKRGLSVLVEKPLSHTPKGLDELLTHAKQAGRFVQVGYMMRYHPLLLRVKTMVDEAAYGGLVHASSHWGEYLPNWHPWEDYRESYAARKDLGGGAGLTLSHDLDVALWLLGGDAGAGKVVRSHGSSLETDVDVAVDVLLKNTQGQIAHVHQNFFERVARRTYTYLFDEARVEVDFFTNSLSISKVEHEPEVVTLPNFDRNDLFVDQSRDFLTRMDHPEEWVEYTRSQINTSRQILELLS